VEVRCDGDIMTAVITLPSILLRHFAENNETSNTVNLTERINNLVALLK
jgi:hypothetical protein